MNSLLTLRMTFTRPTTQRLYYKMLKFVQMENLKGRCPTRNELMAAVSHRTDCGSWCSHQMVTALLQAGLLNLKDDCYWRLNRPKGRKHHYILTYDGLAVILNAEAAK